MTLTKLLKVDLRSDSTKTMIHFFYLPTLLTNIFTCEYCNFCELQDIISELLLLNNNRFGLNRPRETNIFTGVFVVLGPGT